VAGPAGNGGGHGPGRHDDDDEIERFLKRFASREARRVPAVTKWFLYAAVAAIGIEILVAYLDEFPKLHFVTFVLDWLGKIILSCDALVLAVFVCVATLLAVDSTLKLIRIDVVAGAKWIGRTIAEFFRNKGGGGGAPPGPGHDGLPVIDPAAPQRQPEDR
jgi:hypothetical protein